MNNLAAYDAVRTSLNSEQRDMLPHCLIGVLSNLVSEDLWREAVECAQRSAQILRPLPNTKEKSQWQPL